MALSERLRLGAPQVRGASFLTPCRPGSIASWPCDPCLTEDRLDCSMELAAEDLYRLSIDVSADDLRPLVDGQRLPALRPRHA